jgi:GT2 family glycosyltransferase
MDVSVVISTYNRCDLLPAALTSLIAQEARGLSYEIIVVDNNSRDETRRVVESFIADDGTEMRYVFEGKQGLSHGRNAGIANARAPIIAFTDDDVRATPNWVAAIKRAFDRNPQVACVGGKILPQWEVDPPRWLTREHWVALAVQDYGEEPFYVSAERPISLAGANFSFRREAFEEVGLFSPDFPRAQDTEMLVRLWRAGGKGMYVPEAVVIADVQAERLTKGYHRRWHKTNGKFNSLMRFGELTAQDGRILQQPPRMVTLFGAPAYLYRQLWGEAWRWLGSAALRRESLSFCHENRMRFLLGYLSECRRRNIKTRPRSPFVEMGLFAKAMLRKKAMERMRGNKLRP